LLVHPNFQDEAAQSAIAEYVVRNVKEATTEDVSIKTLETA
jgi:hypothetical protein